jgi:hypothetical protein
MLGKLILENKKENKLLKFWKKEKKFKEVLADERILKTEVENYETKIKISYNKLEEMEEKIRKKRHKLEMLLFEGSKFMQVGEAIK